MCVHLLWLCNRGPQTEHLKPAPIYHLGCGGLSCCSCSGSHQAKLLPWGPGSFPSLNGLGRINFLCTLSMWCSPSSDQQGSPVSPALNVPLLPLSSTSSSSVGKIFAFKGSCVLLILRSINYVFFHLTQGMTPGDEGLGGQTMISIWYFLNE